MLPPVFRQGDALNTGQAARTEAPLGNPQASDFEAELYNLAIGSD